jgi:mannose-6-phosphate isomerase-like protein (cupin superfamily)
MMVAKKTKHEDSRGYFQELIRVSENNHEIKQVSWLKINPQQRRGGHYHDHTIETFVVLEGICRVTTYSMDIKDDNTNEDFLLKEGESIVIRPHTHHSFYSRDGATLLVAASQEFDPKDTDTYTNDK